MSLRCASGCNLRDSRGASQRSGSGETPHRQAQGRLPRQPAGCRRYLLRLFRCHCADASNAERLRDADPAVAHAGRVDVIADDLADLVDAGWRVPGIRKWQGERGDIAGLVSLKRSIPSSVREIVADNDPVIVEGGGCASRRSCHAENGTRAADIAKETIGAAQTIVAPSGGLAVGIDCNRIRLIPSVHGFEGSEMSVPAAHEAVRVIAIVVIETGDRLYRIDGEGNGRAGFGPGNIKYGVAALRVPQKAM